MPRPNKIWFRKDIGYWMVTINGKRIRLAEGRHAKKEAQQKYLGTLVDGPYQFH